MDEEEEEGVFRPAVCLIAVVNAAGVCEAKDRRIGSFRLDAEERGPGSGETGKRGETPQTHSSQVV